MRTTHKETKLIPVRVTAAQREYLKDAARIDGTTLSAKIRGALFEWAVQVHADSGVGVVEVGG
jgi:uncharacterized protein (DUF1778 family)